MVSFDDFIIEDGCPIYQQILRHIKRGIIAGSIRDGDELPSRRVLSARLGVNPNTVQKACRILEDEGLICSSAGAKSYMQLDDEKLERVRREILESDAMNVVRALRQMGMSREGAIALIEKYWDRSEED